MQIAPYGTWTSPITAADVAAGEALLEWVGFVGDEVWWTETRPSEQGRSALVRCAAGGAVTDVLDAGWSVRTRVIEYGGRPWLPLGPDPSDGFVFTNWDDQRVYRAEPGGRPRPLSPPPALPAGTRYSDFSRVGDEVWCLREELTGPAESDVRRHLVALPLDGSAADTALPLDGSAAGGTAAVRELAASHHFMTGPKVSPDGRHAVWLGWDHPVMPWQTTDLMCATVEPDGTLGPARRVLGEPGVAIEQVEWAPDRPGVLYVLSDPSGWWNLYEVDLDGARRPLCPRPEEFGEALWRIGARWFLPIGGGRHVVVHGTTGRQLALLEADGTLRDLGAPYTEWASVATDGRRIAATAAGPRLARTVVLVDPEGPRLRALRPAELPHEAYLPRGEHHIFTSDDGQPVHAFVYLPHNPDFTAPAGELPPFLVHVHGGPTNRSQLVVNHEIAFFTSRGIGFLDVQYGGSTGHGRAYRERLDGNWGEVDVRDCAAAARGVVALGLADPRRLAIRGGSAGGWTSAASLAAEPQLYRGAAIYFPVLDPTTWRTHDFESRYLHSLIGPWPQARDRYEEVSPLARADSIRSPFVLLQGLDDAVCPPEQAELLLDRMRERGVPHVYLTFDGEGHGFRRAGTVVDCLHAELSLYAQVLGFTRPGLPHLEFAAPARA